MLLYALYLPFSASNAISSRIFQHHDITQQSCHFLHYDFSESRILCELALVVGKIPGC